MNLDQLVRDLPGAVVRPGDADYAEAASSYHVPGTPLAVVRPRSADEVAVAVRAASESGVPLSVRSGGHTPWGTNDDGLVIDLVGLSQISLEGARVRVGGGAVWGDVAAALAPHGLALTSGDTASVGVGGLTLGGGFGWLIRRDGLALDNLRAVELVTAEGRVVRASADEHAELFWALRGGGGNFGVVTSFEFEAQPLAGVITATLEFDLAELPRVLRGWRDTLRGAPDELTVTVLSMPPMQPDDRPAVQLIVCWAGTEIEAARAATAPLFELPGLRSGELRVADYLELLEGLPPEAEGPMPSFVDHNALFETLDDALIDALTAYHASLGPAVLMLRSLGGAYGRVPRDATAFAHREAEVLVISAGILPPDADDELIAPIRARWNAAFAASTLGSYGNFQMTPAPERLAELYPPETLARLRAVKKQWDPGNVFRLNHNVRPA